MFHKHNLIFFVYFLFFLDFCDKLYIKCLHGSVFVFLDLLFEELDFVVQVLIPAVDIGDHAHILLMKKSSLLQLVPIMINFI